MTEESENPFERVRRKAAKGGGGKAARSDAGDLVAPAPDDAPPLPREWPKLGAPSHSWAFRDPAGRVLRYTLRFPEAAEGEADRPRADWTGKTIRAVTLWREAGGRVRWALKAEPDARPLYGQDALAARPGAPVLVVEGEKDADGAAERFRDFACITWPGGSNAVAKADFSPLSGRSVVVWGDADEPGRKAVQAVSKAARAAGALSVAVVDPPGYFPQGWGLADAWPEGFDQAKAEALIAAARAVAQPGGVVWPAGFNPEDDGIWYDPPAFNGSKPDRVWICGQLEFLGEGRDKESEGWGPVVRFRDPDGVVKTMIIDRGRLTGGGTEVRSELASAGLRFSNAKGKAEKLVTLLTLVQTPGLRVRSISKVGWFGERYILPKEVIGSPGGEPVIFSGPAGSAKYARAGSFEEWRAGVPALAPGNDLLTLALSASFVGALLGPMGWAGGGIHLRGGSSSGKTQLQLAAGSVWGGDGSPQGFVHRWRATDNALEEMSVDHNDGVLILDELKEIQAEALGAAIYMLADGMGKGRQKAGGGARKKLTWLIFVIASGELSMVAHIASGKKGERGHAGQEVRFVDIAAVMGEQNADGSPKGVWQELHGHPNSWAISKSVEALCKVNYGHAGPMFLEAFIARRAELEPVAHGMKAAFLQKVAREGDTGQTLRVAERFAAIAVAGELAVMFGVLPWEPGAAAAASERLFERWAGEFGRDRSHEARTILNLARAAMENPSRWASVGEAQAADFDPSSSLRTGESRSLDPYGWRHTDLEQVVTYRFSRTGWAAVFAGHDKTEAARVLWAAGYIDRNAKNGGFQTKVTVSGLGSWAYFVRGTLLAADDLGD